MEFQKKWAILGTRKSINAQIMRCGVKVFKFQHMRELFKRGIHWTMSPRKIISLFPSMFGTFEI